MRHRLALRTLVTTLALLVGCSNSHTPTPSLIGSWELLGYADHGVEGATTGTATFHQDGTFEVLGSVTYPGEPTDSLEVAGTYLVGSGTVTLTVGPDTSVWNLNWTGSEYILTLQGAAPATRITLGPIP